MQRRIVVAALGTCLTLGCGAESGEETDQLGQPVTILVTSGLPVKKFSYSSYGIMTYVLASPAQRLLFLGSISVQKVPGSGVFTGVINPGTASKPGRANLQVSADIYDSLLSASTTPGPHGVQLSYVDLTLEPVGMTVS